MQDTTTICNYEHEVGDGVFFHWIDNDAKDQRTIVHVVGWYFSDDDQWYLCKTSVVNAKKFGINNNTISDGENIIFTAAADELAPAYRDFTIIT
jgi:hypothetical protein